MFGDKHTTPSFVSKSQGNIVIGYNQITLVPIGSDGSIRRCTVHARQASEGEVRWRPPGVMPFC
jgi:hypothetical protein